MSKAWTTWLRRMNVALIALLLPTGAVGFSALIAGPKNTAIVSVFPPRYSVTDFPATETHTAWAALLVSLAWLLLLARAKGPWGDSGRCALLLALATGSFLAPEPIWFASFYLIVARRERRPHPRRPLPEGRAGLGRDLGLAVRGSRRLGVHRAAGVARPLGHAGLRAHRLIG